MIFFSPAKINIGLNVVDKRNDGFHNIETILYSIDLFDIIEFIENKSKATSLTSSGLDVKTINTNENLVFKAYSLLQKDFNLPSIDIHLHKRIPVGAGLGGGSSNAAFMLRYLNKHFKLDLNYEHLLSYAGKLGSDCSFFICDSTTFACGKGDILRKIEIDLKGYYIGVINPCININTAHAYSLITPGKPKNSLIDQVNFPVSEWKNRIFNDFEKVIFPKYPVIETIKRKLFASGAVYAAMSGSGSSVYGLFEHETDLKQYFPDFFVSESKL
jgi:4-diphosphocytidyl-2-C-methyl-D-erythritol kinase